MNGADEVVGMEHLEPSQPTARGFEPLRAEPNGFLVHLLNHSDTLYWEGAIPANYNGVNNEVMSGLVAAAWPMGRRHPWDAASTGRHRLWTDVAADCRWAGQMKWTSGYGVCTRYERGR